jgi:hypothetical protein
MTRRQCAAIFFFVILNSSHASHGQAPTSGEPYNGPWNHDQTAAPVEGFTHAAAIYER